MKTLCRGDTATMLVVVLLGLMLVLSQSVQAQTYKVIYNFTGGQDGSYPLFGLTMDAGGNLYGTAYEGGSSNCPGGCGTVYRLRNKNGYWILAPLYAFKGGDDGVWPQGPVVFGPNGTLYGTTAYGGSSNCSIPGRPNGCGTVFNLKPSPTAPKSALQPWVETVLYRFQGGNDGALASGGAPVFDASGAMYNGTIYGGSSNCTNGCGTVYKLTPSGQGYTESIIYSFTGGSDGFNQVGTVVFDQAGNLYAVAYQGGGGGGVGTVIQLTPSGGGWTETTLHTFLSADGIYPAAGVILDKSGNLYGTTSSAGPAGGGTVYELTPSSGSWTFNLLYGFTGVWLGGPVNRLAMDADGNLYGTACSDGAHQQGSVFKLSPSGGGWTYADLYDFTGGSDGWCPQSYLLLDANGNLYGTASHGGTHGYGVIFEITP